jgi:hypothetical protein
MSPVPHPARPTPVIEHGRLPRVEGMALPLALKYLSEAGYHKVGYRLTPMPPKGYVDVMVPAGGELYDTS